MYSSLNDYDPAASIVTLVVFLTNFQAAPLNSLVGLFLGYNTYILCYTLGTYYQLPFLAKVFISRLSLKLFIAQLAASIIMILSIVSGHVISNQ